MQSLNGVRALVTGASSGLGFAMARALAVRGADVAAAARPGRRLDAAAAELRRHGNGVLAIGLDVRSEASVASAADRLLARWGGVDLVVNNAGIGMRTVNPGFQRTPQPFYAVSPAAFRDLWETNVAGYFLVARAFAPSMVRMGAGRIVNVSINRATMTRRGFVPYGPSRAASEAMSMVMAEDLREGGVAVNVLLPGGATRTGMIPDGDSAGPPGPPLLDPAVMERPIAFLASPQAAGITGERIVATEFEHWLQARGLVFEAPPA